MKFETKKRLIVNCQVDTTNAIRKILLKLMKLIDEKPHQLVLQ
jgi:hypothetical protein